MQLAFFKPASVVLGFAFVAKTVLRRHQCFGYCWAVAAQHQGYLVNPRKGQAGSGQEAGREKWLKGYSTLYDVVLSDKKELKGSMRRHHGCDVCIPKQLLHVLRSCFLGSACWWEVGKKFLFLFSFHAQLLVFLLDPWAFPSYFLPSFCWREGVRVSGWASGSQPRWTHHILPAQRSANNFMSLQPLRDFTVECLRF